MVTFGMICRKMQLPLSQTHEDNGQCRLQLELYLPNSCVNWPSCCTEGKNERIQHLKGNQKRGKLLNCRYRETQLKPCQVNHVADDDLESSVLFLWHIQSGQGKLYIESLGLLSSNPLESLWDRIFSICRLKFFHLQNTWKEYKLPSTLQLTCSCQMWAKSKKHTIRALLPYNICLHEDLFQSCILNSQPTPTSLG